MAGPTAHQPPPLEDGAGAFGRLHGFAPLESPCRRRVLLAPTDGRAPPGFFPLQGFPLPLRCPRLITARSSQALVPTTALPSCPDSPAAGCATESRSPRWWPCLSRGCHPLLRFMAAWSSRFSADRSWLMVSPRAPGSVAAPCEPSSDLTAPTGAREASARLNSGLSYRPTRDNLAKPPRAINASFFGKFFLRRNSQSEVCT